MRRENVTNRTINGVPVIEAGTFKEGKFYRWQITDRNGREYVDGGNFLNQQEAHKSLLESFDSPWSSVRKITPIS